MTIVQPSIPRIHRDLSPLQCEGGLFDVPPSSMDLNIGRKVRYVHPQCVVEHDVHTIVAVQKNYRGDICYRVTSSNDSFGRVVVPSEIELIG